jgi:alkylation response protein AidB-like acyl-CoA dehydrogenase
MYTLRRNTSAINDTPSTRTATPACTATGHYFQGGHPWILNSPKSQKMFQSMLRDFVDNEIAPHAAEWDESDDSRTTQCKSWLSWDSADCLHCRRSMAEVATSDVVLACEELARGSGVCPAYSSPQSAWPSVPSSCLATRPRSGSTSRASRAREQTVAFALTEAMAGSDVSALDMKYSKEGDEYVLNGTKIFITNGAEADFLVTFATKDRALGYKGISAFIVDKGTPGFSVGKLEKKMGLHPASRGTRLRQLPCPPPRTSSERRGRALR